MPVIRVSHPFGNANVRAVLQALEEGGLLEGLDTTLNFTHQSAKFFPEKIRTELLRRSFQLPKGKVHTHPWREMGRQLALKNAASKNWTTDEKFFSTQAVWESLDRFTARSLRHEVRAVYAYEDGAWSTFREAKKRGLKCIYDLPIGYYQSAQRIFAEERQRMPEFAAILEGASDSPEKLQRKKDEAQMADIIVSCSSFVTRTLIDAGFDATKIAQVQFGCPSDFQPKSFTPRDERTPLKVLFVGRLTQRKGVGYLLHALEKMDGVELHMLGARVPQDDVLGRYRFTYHPPRNAQGVQELMRQCDVLALPSLFEGQALVVLEAMKCGLPVVVTPNTGFEGVVTDGQEGFIVPVADAEALREKIFYLKNNPELCTAMGEKALRLAQTLTWQNYRSQILAIVQKMV